MKRSLITLAMALSVAAPAMADEALAKSKNCMACHAVDKKVVGPAYKEVAKKYAGKGADATVRGESGRGTKTTDVFSLKGISQALDRTAQECR